MSEIKITKIDDILHVTTPFRHLHFITFARKQRAQSAEPNCWIFDASDEDIVRQKLITLYGGDGSTRADVVAIVVNMDVEQLVAPVAFYGRIIASASSRRSGAALGPGVVMLSGVATSGGSPKNWKSIAKGDYLIHNFPRKAANQIIATGPKRNKGIISVRLHKANPTNEQSTSISPRNTRKRLRFKISKRETWASSKKLLRAQGYSKLGTMPALAEIVLKSIGSDVIDTLSSRQLSGLIDRIWDFSQQKSGIMNDDRAV